MPKQTEKYLKMNVEMYISVFGMTLSTAMLVIGGQNIQKDVCKESDAPLYLVILGGVMFGVALLKTLVKFFEPRTRPFSLDTTFAELDRILEYTIFYFFYPLNKDLFIKNRTRTVVTLQCVS